MLEYDGGLHEAGIMLVREHRHGILAGSESKGRSHRGMNLAQTLSETA